MIYVGIDPGLTGALCAIDDTGATVRDLPTVKIPGEGTVKNRIDVRGLYQLLLELCQGDKVTVVIEALATGGRVGGSSAATIGSQFRTRGAIEATFELAGLKLHEVSPQRWKRHYGLVGKPGTDAAKKAREYAATLYPDAVDMVQRVMDHNRAEAILIAHWAKKVLGGSEL